MFCRRKRKEVPPDIFITTPARIMAILQLCLAFTIIAWHAGTPFAGDLYEAKSKLAIYQHVMGTKNPNYAHQFDQLPKDQKNAILQNYENLLVQSGLPYVEKLKKSIAKLILEMPVTEMSWLMLSIAVPILLLKKVEGAIQAVWLLPLAILIFAIDNRWHGAPPQIRADEHLFPKEKYIIQNYIKEPLSQNIFEQHSQLSKGWESYLIHEWANEEASSNKEVYQNQLEKGDFAFQLARLVWIKPAAAHSQSQIKKSYYFLGLALFWNLSFAIVVWGLLFKKQECSNACKIANQGRQ